MTDNTGNGYDDSSDGFASLVAKKQKVSHPFGSAVDIAIVMSLFEG